MCKISEMNLETAKYYGYEAQSNQLVEECAELIQAVNKEAGSDERHGFASATGYKGASSVSDPTGVAVAWGHEARAKGCKGAHLILSDWRFIGEKYWDGSYKDMYNKDNWELTGAKMVVVDGEKIKEDTYYRCIEGEIVEVTEDGEIVEE